MDMCMALPPRGGEKRVPVAHGNGNNTRSVTHGRSDATPSRDFSCIFEIPPLVGSMINVVVIPGTIWYYPQQ